MAGALKPHVDTAALSLPRGNGKSALAGDLVRRILTPADRLFRPGTESVLCAASIEQARVVFRFAREWLEATGEYRFLDSHTRIGITHKESNTRLRVIGSKGKTAMGLVKCPWVIADEPGSWEVNGGTLMYDAIQTAQGKPESPLKALYIGTLAPAVSGWWHDLVSDGTRGSVFVQAIRGNPAKWDDWNQIRRCNPLMARFPKSRAKLLEERDAARADSRLKARFLSYRLNVPTPDEAQVLLTVDDWERVKARPVPGQAERGGGLPLFAYDLGQGRAWSAAVALWQTGRCEAVAVAPGLPSIAEQEKRDRVPRGLYQRLVDEGVLHVAEGLRVPPPSELHGLALRTWGRPVHIISDRFRLDELRDAVRGVPVIPRVTRWSEASEDIRALRKMAADGPLAVPEACRSLFEASLAVAIVRNDDQASFRLVKRDPANNTARDDVAAALTLAAGSMMRAQRRPAAPRYLGAA